MACHPVFLLITASSQAYVIHKIEGYDAVWDDPTVEINIQLDMVPNGPILEDIVRGAMEEWNAAGSNFRFVEVEAYLRQCLHRNDGISTIGWSDDFCGTSFSERGGWTRTSYIVDRRARTLTVRERYYSDINFPWDQDSFAITVLHDRMRWLRTLTTGKMSGRL